MTKQEKIKESYLALFNNEQPEDRFKSIERYINENGWFSGELYEVNKTLLDESGDECRPISLRGIENNNGWIDPTKSGLPQNSCNVFFKETIGEGNTDSEIHIGYWNNRLGRFISYSNSEHYFFDEVTHYRIINDPEPPLY